MLTRPSRQSRLQRERSRGSRGSRGRGFSLLEVLVAVTIVAILAAVVVPRVWRQVFKANAAKAKADATTIATQIKIYMTQNGMSSVPPDFELTELTSGADPLLEPNALKDPWGNTYMLRLPGEGRDFDVMSYGADLQLGGEGDNADIIHN
ncbi:MAG: type II secretion system protein GspG [Phycisphaerae bacterium]|nr:type II secretion system protein GspG [Phycisphaerae bacterium]